MKEVKPSKLKLNKDVVTILSNVQLQQVKGGDKDLPWGSFYSVWGCDTITCCSFPSCSIW
jgi:hypothetical protein